MKFAKELDQDLVPEWRAKYLNYKLGKKKLKAVGRALRSAQSTPHLPGRWKPKHSSLTPVDGIGPSAFLTRPRARSAESRQPRKTPDQYRRSGSTGRQPREIPRPTPSSTRHGERQPLRSGEIEAADRYTRYGSIISTPPSRSTNFGDNHSTRDRSAPLLELPEPALDSSDPIAVDRIGVPQLQVPGAQQAKLKHVQSESDVPKLKKEQRFADHIPVQPSHDEGTNSANAFEIGPKRTPKKTGSRAISLRHGSIFLPKRTPANVPSNVIPGNTPPILQRVLSSISGGARPETASEPDLQLDSYREIDDKQAEFFAFLEQELLKIETFYKEKEQEATDRLKILREQLHIMRDRRLNELMTLRSAKINKRKSENPATEGVIGNGTEEVTTPPQQSGSGSDSDNVNNKPSTTKSKWLKPLDGKFEQLYNGRFGKGTKAMGVLGTPPGPRPNYDQSDYTRRAGHPEIPYRTAKKNLKVALREFYRSLELLKSYSLLNRKAFRKINKKYDKTVNARPPLWFVNEKVNKAWFVQSQVLDSHLSSVEDLYSRYFEKGNHKVAAGKLRGMTRDAGDYTASVFRTGLLLSAGTVFAAEGVVNASHLLFGPDRGTSANTGYLLQIYAGYFLIVLLMLLFCLVCRMWTKAKINYVFVFEYDPRTHLDWRQLCELPSLFYFLFGLILRLNFEQIGGAKMFLYWPVVLIGITVSVICFPSRGLYHRTRLWMLYTDWRLLLSGFYPVEFRDFFMGDMFCSLTYPFGNIELFFCLYVNNWTNMGQCASSSSRLLGFFSCLPGIWRALQCLRRYYDTRNIFPHLVNCGKYTFTILFYMSLSLYRIHKTTELRILFIAMATINATYCSVWDLVMDWSLLNPYAKNPFLRDVLGYKNTWIYYAAMIIDPILRFNWILYAIFGDNIQHAALLSFFVALSEILRRAMWTIFRVENEHCTNVGRFRASRDIPLPYGIESDASTPLVSPQQPAPQTPHEPTPQAISTGADIEAQSTATSISRRRREQTTPSTPFQRGGTLSRMGTILHMAHAQDFERKRKPDQATQAQNGDDSDGAEESDGERERQLAVEEGLLDESGDEDVEARGERIRMQER